MAVEILYLQCSGLYLLVQNKILSVLDTDKAMLEEYKSLENDMYINPDPSTGESIANNTKNCLEKKPFGCHPGKVVIHKSLL